MFAAIDFQSLASLEVRGPHKMYDSSINALQSHGFAITSPTSAETHLELQYLANQQVELRSTSILMHGIQTQLLQALSLNPGQHSVGVYHTSSPHQRQRGSM